MDYQLPDPTRWEADPDGKAWNPEAPVGQRIYMGTPYYTADQVRSAFLAGRLQGLEEAAAQVEDSDERYGWAVQREIATAIRSLKEQ